MSFSFRSIIAIAATVFFLHPFVTAQGQTGATPKDLYYIIIDRSGSISVLVKPIEKAMTNLVGQLPQEAQVTVQFFDSAAGNPRSWLSLDEDSKRELLEWFHKEFKPKGETYLFGTVGDALSRVKSDLARFRSISVYVLSDGDNNITSREYRNWADVERLACELKRAHPYFSVCWYTLGFKPKDKPPAGGCVCIEDPPNPTLGFTIRRAPPSADFEVSPTSAKVNSDILCVLKNGANAEQAIWDFGDGVVVTNQNRAENFMRKHPYSSAGPYRVKVVVLGMGGVATTNCAVEISEDPQLKAAFKWSPGIGRAGIGPVQFVDESSGNPDSFSWIVGSGPPVQERNPSLVLQQPGKVPVVLTVRRGDKSSTTTNEILVLPPVPIPDFKMSTNLLMVGEMVSLSATTNESDWVHHWVIAGEVILEEGPVAHWRADRKGIIEILHQVKNDGGLNEKRDTLYVDVPPRHVTAAFHWSPREIHANDQVALVDDSSGAINSWTWEIQGHGLVTNRNPDVTFANEGTYAIKLTVDGNGGQASASSNLTVLPKVLSLQAAFVVTPTNGLATIKAQFTDKSKGEVANWRWDFGDGQSANVQNPSHEYNQVGTYTPRLTISNSKREEAKDSGNVRINVSAPPPPPPWWRIPAIATAIVLIACWVVWEWFKLRPLYGTLKWEYGGQSGKKGLADCDKSFNLSDFPDPRKGGWKPLGAYFIRNQRHAGGMHVKRNTGESILLADKTKFKLDGVDFEYRES